ncbi:MAG: response regulator transcription factor [Spirochaetaceae bacterium]|jgi:DNA-binding response OmpR family regulator|nr:response regulator transcription factor [Spirochaetaceae bacterium]
MTNNRILLVEDQQDLWKMVKESFQHLNYQIIAAADKEQALFYLKNQSFDLVLLDIMLDGDNGLEILQFVRRQDQLIPIIMLSSLSDMATRKKSFSMGADDYLIKPYAQDEMVMRTKRAIERRDKNQPQNKFKSMIYMGSIKLDLDEQILFIKDTAIELRSKLYHILLLFMQNPNSIIKKHIFHNLIWQNELYDENSLTVHIHQLRKTLSSIENPRIVTVPKLGYKLEYKE